MARCRAARVRVAQPLHKSYQVKEPIGSNEALQPQAPVAAQRARLKALRYGVTWRPGWKVPAASAGKAVQHSRRKHDLCGAWIGASLRGVSFRSGRTRPSFRRMGEGPAGLWKSGGRLESRRRSSSVASVPLIGVSGVGRSTVVPGGTVSRRVEASRWSRSVAHRHRQGLRRVLCRGLGGRSSSSREKSRNLIQ